MERERSRPFSVEIFNEILLKLDRLGERRWSELTIDPYESEEKLLKRLQAERIIDFLNVER